MIPRAIKLTDHERYWVYGSDDTVADALRGGLAGAVNGSKTYLDYSKNLLDAIRKNKRITDPIEKLYETRHLFPLCFEIPKNVQQCFEEGASVAGFHAVYSYYRCPERARLRREGWRLKSEKGFEPNIEMGPLGIGALIHILLAVRVVHGHDKAMWLIEHDGPLGRDLHEMDRIKIANMMLTYDREWPLASEGFEYIGVEANVITDIKGWDGQPLFRSARYDKLVRIDGDVYSLEHKTAAHGGMNAMLSYTPQFWTQCLVWNRNEALVKKWGRMKGVIPDVLVKTEVPRAERMSVRLVNERHMNLALEYMRGAELVRVPENPDGTLLHYLHSCFGDRYEACDYTMLCHDGALNAYTQEKR